VSDVVSVPEPFGRYVLEKKLGRGGMAEVFLAFHQDRTVYSEPLVIKRVLSHLKENRTFLEMFLREARMVASFSHPNIVKILDLGKVGDDFFIAMELVDGLTVDGLGRRYFARHEEVPVALAAQLIADAALGLDHVHRARAADGKSTVIHRDISPDNLMVNTDGVTKILDFGIARPEGEENLTKTGVIKGKIPFMPPEQIESKKLDGRTDLYALGISLYWLLTERRPFDRGSPLLTMSAIVEEQAPPPTRFRPDLPPLVDDIVLSLLEKDPDLRIATGAKLHEALTPLLTLSRAEVATIIQRRMREGDPPRRRVLQVDAPSPAHTRVVPRRDTPESAVFVARTAVTPVDERISPNAVTRATFLGTSPEPAGENGAGTSSVDESREGGRARGSPYAETLRLASAPIEASELVDVPSRVDERRAPTVTVFSTDTAPPPSSTWKGALIGALAFAGVAIAVVASLPDVSTTMPVTGRVSSNAPAAHPHEAVSVPLAPTALVVDNEEPSTNSAVDAGVRARHIGATASIDDAALDDAADGEALDENRFEIDPPTRDGLRKGHDKNRRGQTSTPSTMASTSTTTANKPGVEPNKASVEPSVTRDPVAVHREDAQVAAKPKDEQPRAVRKLDVSAPAHVRFLAEGGKRITPQNGVLTLPLSTKTLVAHDTIRDVQTKIPVGDLPIDYGVLPKGQLSIRAVPYAQVYFGKEAVGTTPLPALKVVVGTYKIRLVYEDRVIERVVEVRPGDLTRVSENMTK
jgi:serine/threonine protein kinase